MTELTIDQALQKGVEAHKAGQVQEADRLYTAILKVKPKHPDANHNMGVLAVGVGKVEQALPFFKKALESNPATAQFWLSYIEALIKLNKLHEAKAVLDQARSKGAKGDGFDKLEQLLNEANKIATETPLLQPNILESLKLDQAIKLAKKKINGGDPKEAKRIYQNILTKFPKNKRASDGLKTLVDRPVGGASTVQDPPQNQLQSLVNFYSQGQLQNANELAKALSQQFPTSAILFNIQGVIFRNLGQLDSSVKAYKKALAIKPDYADAYYNMGNALHEKGKFEEAVDAHNKALEVKPDYAEAYYNKGNALHEHGKLEEAIDAYNSALAIKPDYAEAYYNMGNILREQGKLEKAVEAYNKAIAIKPDYAEAYNNIGVTLAAQSKLEEAIEAYEKALATKPDYADVYNNMGITLKEHGKLGEAIEDFKKALAIKPDYAEAYYNMGNTLKEQGKLEQAIEAYKKGLALKPDFAEAHRHLSILTKYSCNASQINVVHDLLQCTTLNASDRCHLHYTYAKIKEDLGDMSAAVVNYVAGGALRKQLLAYDIADDQNLFTSIKNTAPQFKDVAINLSDSAIKHTPIFILGMPRSGTTLVEQIVSSHTEVTAAGELNYISQFGTKLAAGLTAVDAQAVSVFRKRYLAELSKLADGQAFITDKMPQNFRFIALICAAFPEAKVIHVHRNAEATCWSNFKHYFAAKGLGYSYNLADTVRYYRLYKDLMHVWDQNYSDRIYNLDYDLLTEEQESETRRLIEYLEFSWQDACLAPQRNKRSVKTASQQQIRQKIYKNSSQVWRKYEPFLDGVFDGLKTSPEQPRR